jgi:hypothetical protein
MDFVPCEGFGARETSPTAARLLGEGCAERSPFYGRSATAGSEGQPVWVLDQVQNPSEEVVACFRSADMDKRIVEGLVPGVQPDLAEGGSPNHNDKGSGQ